MCGCILSMQYRIHLFSCHVPSGSKLMSPSKRAFPWGDGLRRGYRSVGQNVPWFFIIDGLMTPFTPIVGRNVQLSYSSCNMNVPRCNSDSFVAFSSMDFFGTASRFAISVITSLFIFLL